MQFKNIFGILFLVVIIGLMACQKEDPMVADPEVEMEEETVVETTPLEEGERVISISLTDNPTELLEVNIDVIGMSILADSVRYSLSTVNGVYNLLDFQDGIDTLISVDTFNITFLHKIALELGDNNSVVTLDGETFPLELPSANRDYLILNFNQELDTMDLVDIQIDFDACKSVHETGNGRWILKPVIKVNKLNGVDVDDESVVGSEKLTEIKNSYPDYDIFEIERKMLCIEDEVMIKVEMKSTALSISQTVMLNEDCELLYTVTKEDIEIIDENIIDAANDAANGNPEMFKFVNIYTSPQGDLIYGFKMVNGNGNSVVQRGVYIDGLGEFVCSE